jgi:hypothetical protein
MFPAQYFLKQNWELFRNKTVSSGVDVEKKLFSGDTSWMTT